MRARVTYNGRNIVNRSRVINPRGMVHTFARAPVIHQQHRVAIRAQSRAAELVTLDRALLAAELGSRPSELAAAIVAEEEEGS